MDTKNWEMCQKGAIFIISLIYFFVFSLKTVPCHCNLEVYNGVSNYCSNPVTGWLQNNSVRIFQLCDRHWIFRRFTSKRDRSVGLYLEFPSLLYHWRLFSVTKNSYDFPPYFSCRAHSHLRYDLDSLPKYVLAFGYSTLVLFYFLKACNIDVSSFSLRDS
jgi:hypothetical protein